MIAEIKRYENEYIILTFETKNSILFITIVV